MKRIWPRFAKRPETRLISEAAFAAIEKRARQFKNFTKFELTCAERAEVRQAAKEYQIDESLQAASLPLKNVIKSIQHIEKRTKDLIWTFEQYPTGTHSFQLHALFVRHGCDPDESLNALYTLQHACFGVGQDMRALNGPGREVDTALEQLVCRLATIFESKGCKVTAPSLKNSQHRASPFVELVLAVYRVAHPTDRVLRERSIEDRIYGALQRRKRAVNSKKALLKGTEFLPWEPRDTSAPMWILA